MDIAPEKLTAERLIEIMDETLKEFEEAFVPNYLAAARKVLQAGADARKQGMADELTIAALNRYHHGIDKIISSLDAKLDAIGEEFGIE